MFALKPLVISGREVLPLVEGGKGISVSNGESSGAWAMPPRIECAISSSWRSRRVRPW